MRTYVLEIQNRLLLIFVMIIILVLVSYFYKEVLLFGVIKPYNVITQLEFDYFIFTNVTDLFLIYLKLIYFVVTQLTQIIIMYQCFIFLSPTLFRHEYYFLLNFIKFFVTLWVLGLLLTSYVFIPYSWHFFLNFQSVVSNKFISLYFEPKIVEYFTFCLTFYNLCVFYCQLFAIIFFLIWFYSTDNIENIKKWRKFYYYIFIVFSTFITPPDIFSQIFIGFSFILFYELFVFCLILKTKF